MTRDACSAGVEPVERVELLERVELVERAGELAALRSAYEGAEGTRGSLVVLGGAVGTGKTAVLRAWTERVARDALVLTATACRAERDLPLGVLEQLVRCCPELPADTAERTLAWCDEAAASAPAPPTTQPDASRVSPTHVPPSATPHAPALRGLCEALRGLVAERPVLIAVDDAHHADAASLQCLLYVVRRLRSARLHVLFTEYVHQTADNALLGSEFAHEPALRRIRVEPLSKAGVGAVLARRFDRETAQDLTPVVHGMSAGHPLLVHALADDHRTTGRAGEAFGRAVLGFLYRHEAPVTEVARAVAVLGEQACPFPLGRLLDVDAASVARAVHQLTVAEVLHEGRLCHPAFGAAVLDGMPTEERRALHGRVAALLHEEGAPADEVAAHLVAADRSDTPWAVPVFEEAAQLALEDDRVEVGVAYLRAAYRRCRGATQQAAIVGALADAEWRLDPAKVLRHLPDRTAPPTTFPPTPLPLTLPTHLFWHGRVDEGLDAICALAGPNPAGAPPANAADLDTPWLWGAYLYPGHVKERLGSGVLAAQRSAPPAATPELQGAGTLMHDLLHGGESDPSDAVDAAERTLNRYRLGPRTVAVQTAALATLAYRDRPHRAAAWCDGLIAQAGERESPTWQAWFTAWRAFIHLRQGDPAAAQQRATTALDMLGPKGWGAAIGLPLAAAVQAKAALGDVDGAAALLERPVPQAVFQTRTGLHYLAARGRYHLATGCHYAALCDFYACGTRMSSWGVDVPAAEPWRLGAAEAYLALGESLLARQLVDEQMTLPAPADGRTWGMTLRLRAATSPGPDRIELLDEAVAVLRGAGDVFELARAVAEQSQAVREGGETERARLLARKAELLSRRWGGNTPPPVAGGHASPPPPAPAPGRAEPDAELTDAERRVAELAADGFTNREISRKLYVTVSTVEQHLTRIYRKLDVKRLDLQAVLG
ncbi:helix-turn-helix transcriptional regulator [Streptomyces venezuelae]|uniref:helix-turn-helix transcriptional regulator n=1 Tax=Streptomyces venezuelae TaxID=54571 RepID=UPI001689D675|nr:LuxR family transcriptional regulator [Streptomyces venezuelae]